MTLKEKLAELDRLQQQIDAYGKLSDDVLKKINYKLRLEWNFTSNSMEGNTLTKDETRTVMANNIDVRHKPIKDIMEMKMHDNVITDIIKIGKGELNISEKRIKDIHKGIMYEETGEEKNLIGKWKTIPNEIVNYKDEVFRFVEPNEVPEKMHDLINWLNTETEKIDRKAKDAIHPVVLAMRFHLDYVNIHPFFDGNGRTARILSNLILISNGYPIFYINREETKSYYRYLADIQSYGGSEDLFYGFISDLIMRSQRLILDAIEGKEIEEPDDLDKKIALLDMELDAFGDPIILEKNKELMMSLLDELIIPLCKILFSKALKISSLFVNTEFAFYINGSGGTHHNINDLVDDVKESWTNNENEIQNFSFRVHFIKLKKLGLKAFDEGGDITLDFKDHKYWIILNTEKIERLYHQALTEEEINEIGNKFANNILSEIERGIENVKPRN